MGSAESTLSTSSQSQQRQQKQKQKQKPINDDNEITTVREGAVVVADPLLQRFNSLQITNPILTSSSFPSSASSTATTPELSLTDILVKKKTNRSSSSSPAISATLNPKVLLELFTLYNDWQEEKAKKIAHRQEEIENKIEVADALAVKLLQRYNYSVSAMRTTAHHLSGVQQLQVEVGELKGRLTEVISNCDALCKRIAAEGPESLRSSVKPFSDYIPSIETELSSSTSSTTGLVLNSSAT